MYCSDTLPLNVILPTRELIPSSRVLDMLYKCYVWRFFSIVFHQSVKLTYADIVLQVDIKYYPMNIILINIGN